MTTAATTAPAVVPACKRRDEQTVIHQTSLPEHNDIAAEPEQLAF
jgi:hypothetical protein